MKKLTFFLIYLSLTIEAYAAPDKVVSVDGASLSEISSRAENGLMIFYKVMSLVFAIVGFVLFSRSVIKLIQINQGDAPQSKQSGAFAGMFFAALLVSSGYWLFMLSRAIQTSLTS